MKNEFLKYLIIFLLSNNLFGQISNGTEFLNFALLTSKEKHLYISERNWRYVGVNRKKEDDYITEDVVYSKIENGITYELTLRGVLFYDGKIISITMLLINDEKVYNSWVKKWKDSGIEFKKDPESEDKYMSFGDDFMIMLEKIYEKGLTLYQISII